ncbi:Cupin domain protein [Halogranum amylolyticum]|uniref:Cupin domain protein n=1 Tax=Halogranum amylolyticum TaxID=660520 RepID=A0A1H8WTZ0_9EURY|nr:cupin domain-containing protein [Halogranum amylolyticum]SEP31099.1 Cupin domain protein [Halogranum amylolyticum]
MHERLNLDETDARDLEEFDPKLKAVGYELRPEQMRPSVWVYEEGDASNRHYHEEQEELYHVLSGRFELRFDGETEELTAGDMIVVSPDEIRQLVCVEAGEVFVVGAPSVKDDGVVDDE